ncbi:MAG: hypothetical protein SFV15_16835 [Polyangiaceae bacterium]|nr:hypothetical protein [Polyangiaceae bacterium]
MARVNEHKRLRPQPPRRKNLPEYSAPKPDGNRVAGGRFAPGNRAAEERAIKAIIRKQLGPSAGTEEVAQLYKDSLQLFRKLLTSLPSNDSPEVQDLIARRARWSVLSARFAAKAVEQGLFDEQGSKLLDMSLKLDARAERLAVTARDEAERIHRSRPQQNSTQRVLDEINAAIGAKP